MKKVAGRKDSTTWKTAMERELEKVYGDAVAKVETVLKRYGNPSVYEREDDWDDTVTWKVSPDRMELDASDIVFWLASRPKDPSSAEKLYIFSVKELEELRRDRVDRNIRSWKDSIRVHEETIAKYRKLIAAAEKGRKAEPIRKFM